MRVLVTGAQGYLGCQLVDILLKNHEFCVIATGRTAAQNIVPCDLLKKSEVQYLIGEALPDLIIHCAAHVPKRLEEYNNKNTFEINIDMMHNILDFSECPLFFVSSMTVYGKPTGKTVKESDPKAPLSAYGESKLICEKMIEMSERSGFAIRLPGLFGLPRKSGIVYNVLAALKAGGTVHLPEKPFPWSSMAVHDAANSIIRLLKKEIHPKFQALNIGYPGGQSINLLLQYASEISGRAPCEYDVHHPLFEFDLTNAERYGVVPRISFYDALKNTFLQL